MDDFDKGELVAKAEKKIRQILIELQDDAEIKIDAIRADTRNYANMAVEIVFE